jgi:hypothetical protein
MLIAFGTMVALPAIAAVKIEQHAFQPPETQHQQTLKNAGKGVTTGSAVSHNKVPQWYLRSEATTLPPGTGPG